MSRAWRVWPLALLAVFSASQLAAQSAAQSAADAAAGTLDRLEARIESGDTDGVADALERWLAAARNPPRDALGRARYLRARLISDADAARDELLALALDGGSGWAARAWLRLGQLELAAGDPVRAEAALERLARGVSPQRGGEVVLVLDGADVRGPGPARAGPARVWRGR